MATVAKPYLTVDYEFHPSLQNEKTLVGQVHREMRHAIVVCLPSI